MLQTPAKEITLIVYNTPTPPRYIKINKSLIRSLIFIIPLLVISSISASFLYSMFLKNQVNKLKAKEPELIAQLKNEKIQLLNTVQDLAKRTKILTLKVSKGASGKSFLPLGLFTVPLGMQDLRDKELLQIENIELKNDKKMIFFSFNLANKSEDGHKLSGYITVLQHQGSLIQFYPHYELNEQNLRFEFSKGESFSFSRFRPTSTQFPKLQGSSVKYKIFIFTRTGDLIAYQQAGPFNIE